MKLGTIGAEDIADHNTYNAIVSLVQDSELGHDHAGEAIGDGTRVTHASVLPESAHTHAEIDAHIAKAEGAHSVFLVYPLSFRGRPLCGQLTETVSERGGVSVDTPFSEIVACFIMQRGAALTHRTQFFVGEVIKEEDYDWLTQQIGGVPDAQGVPLTILVFGVI